MKINNGVNTIYLISSNADKYFNGNLSDCDEIILSIIEVSHGFHIYLSVQKSLIPYSF
jgi:hypothetical protein